MVAQANQLLGKVQTTSDSTLDARFMSQVAELGAEKVQKLPFGVSDFGLDEFMQLVRRTIERFRGGSIDEDNITDTVEEDANAWHVIGLKASVHWKGVVGHDFILGPIKLATPEQIKTRRTKARTDKAPLKEVEAISKEDFEVQAAEASASATPNNVMMVDRVLQQFEQVPFHQFITDPNSFARSVENMFYCSFLVAEGRASLSFGADGDVYISPIDKEETEQNGDGTDIKPKHQNVFNFSVSQWSAAKRKYNITSAILDMEFESEASDESEDD